MRFLIIALKVVENKIIKKPHSVLQKISAG